jgi:hypothetical protein
MPMPGPEVKVKIGEDKMSTVLQLQRLAPCIDDANLVLVSTYSGICPTTAVNDHAAQFEME